MAESELYAGIVTALLDKFAEPAIKGLVGSAKNEWEKFKVDLDIVFRKYLKNSVLALLSIPGTAADLPRFRSRR